MDDMPQSSFQPSFSITNAIATALTQIERARGFLEAATLSEQWVRAMGGKGVASMAVFSAALAWHAGSRETELVEGPLNVATGFLPVVIDVERRTGRRPVPTWGRARMVQSGP